MEDGGLEEQLSSDLQQVNSLNQDQLEGLVNLVLNFLMNPATSEFQSGLGAFAEEHRVNVGVLKTLARGVIIFLQGAMKDGCSGADLARKCLSFQFSPEATATVQKCWQLKAGQMAMSILSRTITANQLVDMDWSFGVTASSDDCDNIGKTYLILKLTIDGEGGLKDVFLELSLDQFYQFLAQMENCKSYLDFMDSA